MKLAIWSIFLGLLGFVGWWFGSHNSQPIGIDLWLRQYNDVPLWGGLVGVAAVGGLIALFALAPSLVRLRLRARRQVRSIGELEQEVHGLRTLPLSDEIET